MVARKKTLSPEQDAYNIQSYAEINHFFYSTKTLLVSVQQLYAREEHHPGLVRQVSCNSEGTQTAYRSM